MLWCYCISSIRHRSRLLPPVPLAMLFFGTVANVIVIAEDRDKELH
jgi:hypothetical protein